MQNKLAFYAFSRISNNRRNVFIVDIIYFIYNQYQINITDIKCYAKKKDL